MPSLPQNRPDIPLLRFVVDSNVWIDAVSAKEHKRRESSIAALEKATSEGIVIGSKKTFHDLANALFKKVRKNEMTHDEMNKVFDLYKENTNFRREKEPFEEYVKKYEDKLSKCTDKSDYVFLSLAHEHRASHIITNDMRHLVSMGQYMAIKIVTPLGFVFENLPRHQKPQKHDENTRGMDRS